MPKPIVGARRVTVAEAWRAVQRRRQARKISFVGWCWNRTAQVVETLPANLEATRGYRAEFCILCVRPDPDGERLDAFLDGIQDPRLRVVRQTWPPEARRFSAFYNAAAELATGDAICFLDIDNFATVKFCDVLTKAVTDDSFVWGFSGSWQDGSCGRIALTRNAFERLGGFDESLPGPVGAQDIDLVGRARAMGLRCVRVKDQTIIGVAVQNSKADTASVLGLDVAAYRRSNARNAAASKQNIALGRIRANQAAIVR